MKAILFLLPFIPFALIGQQETNNLNVKGLMTCDSIHYNNIPSRVCAYVNRVDTTTIITAGTYYFLQGGFANTNTINFGFSGDTLQYQNGNHKTLKGGYGFTVKSNKNTCTVSCAVYLNNSIEASSIGSFFCKTAGEVYTIENNNWMLYVHNNDLIKIRVTCDISDTEIILVSGSTSLFQLP